MRSKDFLFELGTEELPSRAVKELSEALAVNVCEEFKLLRIKHGAIQCFGSPRRIGVLVNAVETVQPSQKVLKRGPAVDANYVKNNETSSQVIGFAKSFGIEVSDLTRIKNDKGEWWGYEYEQLGLNTNQLLGALVNAAVKKLPVAKYMTWGNGDYQFSRPVHWAVLLFGEEVIVEDILGVKTGCDSYGHRFHNPEKIQILAPCLYENLLNDAKVIVSFNKRRDIIKNQIELLAAQNGLTAVIPDSLLDEVCSIVEWPKAMLASFDAKFLEIPEEVLIESMQHHQKSFALKCANQKLANNFIFVANIESTLPMKVINGNEMVMQARLSDAAFFFEKDKSSSLFSKYEMLSKVMFHADLGSVADKVSRMQFCAKKLSLIFNVNEDAALRAIELAKCDLLTGMVGEFPELQGLMGYYYATHDGESSDVCIAIKEQYLPRFSSDSIPATSLGKALSLLDRIDILVGLFAIGKKPTGVKDPFKLRRHALAIVRILIEMPGVSLSKLLDISVGSYKKIITKNDFIDDLKLFILDRMQSFYQAQGIDAHFLNAVRANQEDDFFDINNRINALLKFVKTKESSALAMSSKRVLNILSKAEFKNSDISIDVSLFNLKEEDELNKKIDESLLIINEYVKACDYDAILNCLTSFKTPVDNFFDNVMVVVDDTAIKLNRLSLLAKLQQLFQSVADISLVHIQ